MEKELELRELELAIISAHCESLACHIEECEKRLHDLCTIESGLHMEIAHIKATIKAKKAMKKAEKAEKTPSYHDTMEMEYSANGEIINN